LPDSVCDLQVDVVLANILAAPLISLASRLTGFLLPRGRLALSGILRDQAQSVGLAYDQLLEQVSTRHREEWVLMEGRRAKNAIDRP
jgi:ribosomal protein L11 methyltransferase